MSDSDEDNVIRYGTPLEPFDEEEVPSKKKFQPKATDQYAVDDHGRRRFHGAFTGGFSAGQGNTVGTAEGFTPATFKSSRKDKAQSSSSKSQRPEDFMDEEDRSEFGIAPRYMQTHSDFSGQKRLRPQRFHDGPIPGEPVLEQVLQTVHETAAVRILKAQGWRPGQGAVVRLTAGDKAKRKVYGCSMPGQSTEPPDSDSDTSIDYDTLFAPDDYEPCASRVKSDRFGLGYRGLSRRPVLGAGVEERSHLKMTDKGKKVSIRGQAFGVGALEEDDEDIYANEDMSHYDFSLGQEKREEKKKSKQESGVLEGFVKASKQLPPSAAHPPPALPRDYVPCVAGARRSRFAPTDTAARDQGLGRHELSAQARGALLGETLPTPTAPIQPTITDPIAKLLGRNVNFVTTSNVETTNTNAETTNTNVGTTNTNFETANKGTTLNFIPNKVDSKNKETASDFIPISNTNEPAVKVFKPFASTPSKQLRYEKYVQSGVLEEDGDRGKLAEWERNREMMEFNQAAKLYRPLTGVMGDRFTHASQPDERATDPLAAVARTPRAAAAPAAAAARAGAYGALTRSTQPWRPDGLLCKRFNVPDPNGARAEPQKEDRPKVSYSIFSYLESSIHDKESFTKEQTTFSGSKSVSEPMPKPGTSTIDEPAPKMDVTPLITEAKDVNVNKRLTVAELFMRESEKDLKESQTKDVTETIAKFDKMELYKAIFLDSEEDEPKEQEANSKPATDYNEFTEVPKNVERNLSPPRGIFANINFDELNSWKRNEPKEVQKEPDIKPIEEANLYGPKIPESINKRLAELTDQQVIDKSEVFRPSFRSKNDREKEVQVIDSSSSEDSWVEAKEKKSKKKKSKKSKSKHKNKKSKHKKKDRLHCK